MNKKFILFITFAVLFGGMFILLSSQKAGALTEKQLYDCPSVMNYDPSWSYIQNCKKWVKTMGVADTCAASYKESGMDISEQEYKAGKCKPSKKQVQGKYSSASCNITYKTTPSAEITGSAASGSELDAAQCLENLYKGLKSVYPNIKRSSLSF